MSFLDNQTIKPGSFYFQSFSAYAQDRWNIGSRLTLTYGLRWEVDPAPTPTSGTFFAAWQNVNNPAQIAPAPAGTPLWNTTYGNFAPRVGIAWRATQRGDLVIRAGFGVFYDLGTGVAAQVAAAFPNNAIFSAPFPPAHRYLPRPNHQLSVHYRLHFVATTLRWPEHDKGFAGPETAVLVSMECRPRKIPLGQAGTDADLSRPDGTAIGCEKKASRIPTPTFRALVSSLRVMGIHLITTRYRFSSRRPLAQGLQALASYTYSHCIDTNSNDSFLGLSHFILSVSGERGSCDFDVRHNVTGAVTYEVPNLKQNRFLKTITEGWSLD